MYACTGQAAACLIHVPCVEQLDLGRPSDGNGKDSSSRVKRDEKIGEARVRKGSLCEEGSVVEPSKGVANRTWLFCARKSQTRTVLSAAAERNVSFVGLIQMEDTLSKDRWHEKHCRHGHSRNAPSSVSGEIAQIAIVMQGQIPNGVCGQGNGDA
jgi:hypothetical protein